MKLFSVYLGGELAPGRMGEDHEVVFVVAEDVPAARKAAKAKWRGSSRPHVDAVVELDAVDGHRIEVVPDESTGDALVIDSSYNA